MKKKYMKENILLDVKYTSKIFIQYCKDEGIHHQFITYYSSQQSKTFLQKIMHIKKLNHLTSMVVTTKLFICLWEEKDIEYISY
jgi:hypothetical protein